MFIPDHTVRTLDKNLFQKWDRFLYMPPNYDKLSQRAP